MLKIIIQYLGHFSSFYSFPLLSEHLVQWSVTLPITEHKNIFGQTTTSSGTSFFHLTALPFSESDASVLILLLSQTCRLIFLLISTCATVHGLTECARTSIVCHHLLVHTVPATLNSHFLHFTRLHTLRLHSSFISFGSVPISTAAKLHVSESHQTYYSTVATFTNPYNVFMLHK
jgi:hypothetical protein